MIERLVSGGQTGVDRAALDAALALGLACGGWCPRGRRAEDGPLDARYPLRETPERAYAQRSRWNVRDADATLLLARGAFRGGSALTRRLARASGKPWLALDPWEAGAAARVRAWLAAERVRVLNVAGPRESQEPGVYARARALLGEALAPAPASPPDPRGGERA